jgi:hypothetical protein
MVLQAVETYWLLMKNKSNGQIKIVEFLWNDTVAAEAEKMLKKAERTNHLVQIGEAPSADMKIADADVCADCAFFDTCLPDLSFGPGAVIFGDEDVAEMTALLERRAELEPLTKEFKEIDEDLKSTIKSASSQGQTQFVIGSWLATIKEIQKKSYTVAAHGEKHVKFLKTEGA